MPNVFVSYARSDAQDPLHRKFCEALGERIAARFGSRPEDAVFIDQSGIQVGEGWEQTLSDALSTCQCFVAILSRAYLASDLCGREWGAFASRVAAQATGGDTPSVLLPIVWQLVPLPREIAQIQWSHASLGDHYARAGLAELAHFYPDEYARFLDTFAEHVHRTAVRFGLPRARQHVNLRNAPNAFRRPAWRRPALAVGLATVAVALVLGIVSAMTTLKTQAARSEAARWIDACASSRDPRFLATPAPPAVDRLLEQDLLDLANVAFLECPAATTALVSRAVQRMPQSPEAWRLEGKRRYEAGAYAEALAAFEHAMDLGGGGEVLRARARAKRQLGDRAGYDRDIEEACRQGDHGACELR